MRRALTENPDAIWANRTLSVAHARCGERQAADRALALLRKSYPAVTITNVTSVLHFRPDFVERVAVGLNDLGLPAS